MITIDTVRVIAGKEVIPVRAVPFVTGGDICPLGIAQLLADPDTYISAYVMGENGEAAPMLPKEWRRFKSRLANLQESEAIDYKTIEFLPASTFVRLEDLWRVYVDYYLPPREDLPTYTPAESENFQLQPRANIPAELVNLVFQGFPRVGVWPKSLAAYPIDPLATAPENEVASIPLVNVSESPDSKQIKTDVASLAGPIFSVKKRALIAQHKDKWPTIERDLQDASNNGLSKAAKAAARDWNEAAALAWAKSKGKLSPSKKDDSLDHIMSNLPGQKHAMDG